MQTGHVMLDVAHKHVNQRAGADRPSAGRAELLYRFVAYVRDREDVCAPQEFEFLDQVVKPVLIEAGLSNIVVLLETGQRSWVIP